MQPRVLQRRNSSYKIGAVSFLSTFVFAAVLAAFGNAFPVFASTGNIDPAHKYAFSNFGGYINFAPTNAGVTVTDTDVAGYAWSANDGWINLSPAQGGVHNDGNGVLSGFAWDPAAGWVNFTGVSINTSTGKFSGLATGNSINGSTYGLNFDCTSCDVVTTWRPASPPPPPPSGGGGGGPVIPPILASSTTPAPTPVMPPPQNGNPPPGTAPPGANLSPGTTPPTSENSSGHSLTGTPSGSPSAASTQYFPNNFGPIAKTLAIASLGTLLLALLSGGQVQPFIFGSIDAAKVALKIAFGYSTYRGAADLLRKGKIGVIPTDTLYGIVAGAFDEAAVERVYAAKKRSPDKPCIILIPSVDELQKFHLTLSEKQNEVISKYWPGPVSIVFKFDSLDFTYSHFTYLHRGTGTLSFRIPADPEMLAFLRQIGPVIAPSANPEGMPPAKTISEAKAYFGDQMDFYRDGGLRDGLPSTLISLDAEGKIAVLRNGGTKIS